GGDLLAARQAIMGACTADPSSSAAHASLGVVLGSLGDLDGQQHEEEVALQLNPKSAAAHANLAWVLARKKEWTQALSQYQQALALNNNLLEAQTGQGLALFHTGKEEAGIAAVRTLVHGHPTFIPGMIALATMLKEHGRTAEALAETEKAL